MESKKISVAQLASKINMTKGGLYATIDNQTMTIATLQKISKVLEVPVSVFFDEFDPNQEVTKEEHLSAIIELKKINDMLMKNNDLYVHLFDSHNVIFFTLRGEMKILINQIRELKALLLNSSLSSDSLQNSLNRVEYIRKQAFKIYNITNSLNPPIKGLSDKEVSDLIDSNEKD